MIIRVLALTTAICGVAPVSAAPSQPGLNVGTLTATVDGEPFAATVGVATMDGDKLILSSLANAVQIQVPDARPGDFPLTSDTDEPGSVTFGIKVATGSSRPCPAR
jgi:hypothetical protein